MDMCTIVYIITGLGFVSLAFLIILSQQNVNTMRHAMCMMERDMIKFNDNVLKLHEMLKKLKDDRNELR